MNSSSSNVDFLKAQLEVANAQNVRLSQENTSLRDRLKSFIDQDHSSSTLHIEAKLKAFKFEEERDRMFEKLEKIKQKYNQLHEAYLEKLKRCKAFEDVFKRQKTLNGLVMKSSIDQRQKEQEIAICSRQTKDASIDKENFDNFQDRVVKLQTALNEAYDIIDELEFELESVDLLEVENQRMRNELKTYKQENHEMRKAINHKRHTEYVATEEEATGGNYDEQAEYRQCNDKTARFDTDSTAPSLTDYLVGDIDPAIIERAALTESLINIAESESNCLRRELLRSRLQKANRLSIRPST